MQAEPFPREEQFGHAYCIAPTFTAANFVSSSSSVVLVEGTVTVQNSFNNSGVRLFDVLPTRNYFLTISGEF